MTPFAIAEAHYSHIAALHRRDGADSEDIRLAKAAAWRHDAQSAHQAAWVAHPDGCVEPSSPIPLALPAPSPRGGLSRRMENPRIVIIGGPKAGKTTLAGKLGIQPVQHTDDVMGLGWSESSAKVATWFDRPGPWVVEGVATARALRKWLVAHPEGKPCDLILLLTESLVDLNPGQESMRKGVDTVFDKICDELELRGVPIRFVSATQVLHDDPKKNLDSLA